MKADCWTVINKNTERIIPIDGAVAYLTAERAIAAIATVKDNAENKGMILDILPASIYHQH
jgi:hypothetical protein